MKKYTFAALFIVLAAGTLSSCKKDYTCRCSDSAGGQDVLTVNGTRKQAYDKCMEYQNRNYGNTSKTSCALK